MADRTKVKADRTVLNLRQQTRRSNLLPEELIAENEKNRIREAKRRLKNRSSANDTEPTESVLPEDTVSETPAAAACTPILGDNADESREPCTSSSSSSDLKRRKLNRDDMKCVEDEIQESKEYNFFHHAPQSDSSTMMTEQQQQLIIVLLTEII
jgi:hypothetical protein